VRQQVRLLQQQAKEERLSAHDGVEPVWGDPGSGDGVTEVQFRRATRRGGGCFVEWARLDAATNDWVEDVQPTQLGKNFIRVLVRSLRSLGQEGLLASLGLDGVLDPQTPAAVGGAIAYLAEAPDGEAGAAVQALEAAEAAEAAEEVEELEEVEEVEGGAIALLPEAPDGEAGVAVQALEAAEAAEAAEEVEEVEEVEEKSGGESVPNPTLIWNAPFVL